MNVASKFFFIVLFFLHLELMAQAPKREFRAVWVATVKNIDWPSEPELSTDQQKNEFLHLLDYHKMNGFNAIIMQVRPAADAFYASDIEPWSRYLNGKSGQAPYPFYDPLTFMIDAVHERGMEFHAWFNPYRAIVDMDEMPEDSSNTFYQHPEWFVTYGDKMYFDPGLPEVKEYTVNVIKDVVTRYDIDAIHFDDYFYPYRVPGQEFPDSASFAQYGQSFTEVQHDDWRRENVNTVIQMLSDTIKRVKPWVKFGISPFGVWRNKDKDPRGSDSHALQTNYDDLFADVLKWMDEGWIDYVLPQLYLHIGHPKLSFSKVLDWWDSLDYNGHLYVGHGAYRVGQEGKDTVWMDPQEIPRQVALVRDANQVLGSAYFSSKSFLANPLGLSDRLRRNEYSTKALVPAMPWLDSVSPVSPELIAVENEKSGVHITWKNNDSTTQYFAVYRFEGKRVGDFEDPSNILEVLHVSTPFFIDRRARRREKYTYAITAMDRLYNESKPSAGIYIKATEKNP